MWPPDTLIPLDAKYFGIVDTETPYSTASEIVWSFSFALTGTEHGFSTFLTPSWADIGITTEGYPGHRLSYLYSTANSIGKLCIAFDTTGLFALSSTDGSYTGATLSQINPNSLIIRDSFDNLLYNEPISSLDSSFFLTSSVPNWQTLRFRLTDLGRLLYIDKLFGKNYKNILTLPISTFNYLNYPIMYCGFTFVSPVSSLLSPSTFWIKNFHSHGKDEHEPTEEIISTVSIYPNQNTTFSTISNIL